MDGCFRGSIALERGLKVRSIAIQQWWSCDFSTDDMMATVDGLTSRIYSIFGRACSGYLSERWWSHRRKKTIIHSSFAYAARGQT